MKNNLNLLYQCNRWMHNTNNNKKNFNYEIGFHRLATGPLYTLGLMHGIVFYLSSEPQILCLCSTLLSKGMKIQKDSFVSSFFGTLNCYHNLSLTSTL